MVAPRLLASLRAVCPVTDLSIGSEGVSASVVFVSTGTTGETAAAQAVLDAFDWSAGAQAIYDQQQTVKEIGRFHGTRKGADQGTTSTAFGDVTGLSFTLAPNTHYKFRFSGAYNTALAATGIQLSVNGPASPSFMSFLAKIFTTASTLVGGAAGNYDVALSAPTSAGATPLPFELEGTISTGAAGGAFTLRFRTETNGSAVTILRGSIGELAAVA